VGDTTSVRGETCFCATHGLGEKIKVGGTPTEECQLKSNFTGYVSGMYIGTDKRGMGSASGTAERTCSKCEVAGGDESTSKGGEKVSFGESGRRKERFMGQVHPEGERGGCKAWDRTSGELHARWWDN